jgi:hypothetical protein
MWMYFSDIILTVPHQHENALQQTLTQTIALIAQVPGYAAVAADLATILAAGKIRIVPTLVDRGHAGLLRDSITLGLEPFDSVPVGLAETLVHEHFHLGQHPLLKTASFWSGVFTQTNIMRRYEAPAYRAGVDFLRALSAQFPQYAPEAENEISAICQTYETDYGTALYA